MAHRNMQKRTHHQRDDLIGEHKMSDAGQAVFACLFVAIWIIDTFFLKYTTFPTQYVPLVVRIPCGVVLLVLSGYLASTGLAIVFGEERENPAVIRKGVFSVMRHPIYLSEVLLYLGLLMLSISLAAAVVWVGAIVFLYYISRYEEKLLLEHFGKEYAKYMREVPMWIPRLRKNKTG
ncbi:MAG: isoprenylcysteine carboxylmethyltransferase family protein [Deltaproteobacteria bacterium]|nr:isoprenylcysteine carboxylmethyltransferase family protein [Deltaproteobacteria bacterium]